MTRFRLVAAGVAASITALGLTACGTTVPLNQLSSGGAGEATDANGGSTPAAGPGGLASSAPGAAGASGATPATGSGSAPGSAGTATASAAGAAASGPSTDGSPLPAGAVTQSTSAITGTAPIEVGIPYLDSSETNAFTSSVGSGLNDNDPSVMYTDYIDQLNAQGGILGHKVVPLYDSISASDTTTQIAATACSYFTQDHKVSFVLSPPIEQLYSCLAKAGVAVLNNGYGDETSETELAAEPLAVLPESIALDRYAGIEAAQLDSMGFFGHGVTDKLGVMYFDNDQDSEAGFSALQKALAAEHVPIAVSQSITEAAGISGVGGMEAEVQSAELKFATDGVNEVTCVETTPWICAFFALYASDQGYYPRYAFSSGEAMSSIVANVPAKELTNSVLLGWYPAQDLQSVNQMPPATQACFTFFEKAGLSIANGNSRSQAEGICSDVDFFAAALRAAPEISPAGFVQGAEKISSTYNPIDTFGIRITPSHRDGPAVIRRGAFVPSCDCYQYTSGEITVG